MSLNSIAEVAIGKKSDQRGRSRRVDRQSRTAARGAQNGARRQRASHHRAANRPHGRIAFANTDLAGASDHRNSIREADRAVQQLLAT